jgi:hypothetical protein
MADRKSGDPSPESVARANRQRIAAEEGRHALIDVERKAVAVRNNMVRLRALREADEIKKREMEAAAPAPAPKKTRAKAPAKQSP